MKKNILYFMLMCLLILTSCSYERTEGCHLDKLNLKGNITKVETIVESAMPLTEMFQASVDPSLAVSTFDGNFLIKFNKKGNIIRNIGYGVDGKLLFDEGVRMLSNKGNFTPAVTGLNNNQCIDKIEMVSSSNNVYNVRYYSRNKLMLKQKAYYNDDGNPDHIIKEYVSLSIKNKDNYGISHDINKSENNGFLKNNDDEYLIRAMDSTYYKYLAYDSHNNWTKALVTYRGLLPKHKHEYIVTRQITYDGDKPFPPLIQEMKKVSETTNSLSSSKFVNVNIGNYGRIQIPYYMALQSKDYMAGINNHSAFPNNYLFLSTYDKQDAYASFSVSQFYSEDNSAFEEIISAGMYSKEIDDVLKEMNVQQMAEGGVFVLKWLPYKVLSISGKPAMKYSYYRYGKGSPIPVYCEIYTILMDNNYTLSVVFSYQSNLKSRFYKDFTKSIESIKFY